MLLVEALMAKPFNANRLAGIQVKDCLMVLGAERDNAVMAAGEPAGFGRVSGYMVDRGRPAADKATHLGNPIKAALVLCGCFLSHG